MMSSSSGVHFSFLIPGLKTPSHRSRHCLPIRPEPPYSSYNSIFKRSAMNVQFFTPCSLTSLFKISSSRATQRPSLLLRFYQRCMHAVWSRFSMCKAIIFQFLEPFWNFSTYFLRSSSSSGVQLLLFEPERLWCFGVIRLSLTGVSSKSERLLVLVLFNFLQLQARF